MVRKIIRKTVSHLRDLQNNFRSYTVLFFGPQIMYRPYPHLNKTEDIIQVILKGK